MTYKFTIPGEAKGKGRPRFFRKGNHVGTFTPAATASYENLVKLCFVNNYPGKRPLEGALEMEIVTGTAIPKSYSKKKKQLAAGNLIRPTKKPDLDNIAKIIADSLNGVAYQDDKQIVSLKIKKLFAELPETEVEIKQIEENNA